VNTLVALRGKLDLFVSNLLIKLSQVLSLWTWVKFGPNYIKSLCSFLLLIFCLDITSLLYNSFSFCKYSHIAKFRKRRSWE